MMEDDGLSFDEALRDVAQHTVFTTHTPVPAGHDRSTVADRRASGPATHDWASRSIN